MALRMILFGTLMTTLLGGGAWLVARRFWPSGRPEALRRAWGVFVLLLVVPAPVSFALLRSGAPAGAREALHWWAYLGMGTFSLLFAGVLVLELGRWVARRIAAPVDPARRAFFGVVAEGGVLAAVGTVVTLGYAEARRIARVKEVEVPIAGLPTSLAGFRIVQLTDVHVGPTIRRDYLQGIVDRVNELSADMVAITGDLMDGTVEGLREDMAPLGTLKSRHGTFFCTGNHEYYSGVEPWLVHLATLGVRPLVNAHAVLDHDGAPVVVAGVTDHSAARMMPAHASDAVAAARGAPPAPLRLLLAHQPRSAFAAAATGAFDLQLSGHTHGGQYVPWTFFIGLVQPFATGLHRLEKMWIYTSRGTGYWGPPIRLGSPAEITLLKMVPA